MNLSRGMNAIQRQRGAVLITALLILLLLTVFGVSTMDNNILEERMAGNMRDRNLAFQKAEAAIRACEAYIAANTNLPNVSTDGSTSIWRLGTPDAVTTNNLPWWNEWGDTEWADNTPANAVIQLGDTVNGITVGTALGIAPEPACVIEKLPEDEGPVIGPLAEENIYLQVTARGVGGNNSTVVLLQSVYKW